LRYDSVMQQGYNTAHYRLLKGFEMYTSFEIENFRGFEKFKLEKLARINLIAGQNNVGKTALLEALWVHTGRINPELLARLNVFRGLQNFDMASSGTAIPDVWSSLFYGFDVSHEIQFTSSRRGSGKQTVVIKFVQDVGELKKIQAKQNAIINNPAVRSPDIFFAIEMRYDSNKESMSTYATIGSKGVTFEPVPSPRANAIFENRRIFSLEQLADQFTQLVKQGKRTLLLETLRIIEPSLTNVELLTFSGELLLSGTLGEAKPIPLNFMGDGINSLARLICEMGFVKNGFLLIDEIENGLHYSIQKDVWKAIHKAAIDFNVQVFATTHSRECILAAHETFRELDAYNEFQYIRLEKRKDNKIIAIPFSQGSTEAAFEKHLEIR